MQGQDTIIGLIAECRGSRLSWLLGGIKKRVACKTRIEVLPYGGISFINLLSATMNYFNGTEIAIEELSWAAMLNCEPEPWILGSLAHAWFVKNAKINSVESAHGLSFLLGLPVKVDPAVNPWTVKIEVESL